MADCIKCKYNEFGDCALLNDKEISFFYVENGGCPDWCPLQEVKGS